MKIRAKHFRVSEGDKVNLQKLPTTNEARVQIEGAVRKLLSEHGAQLSSQKHFFMHLTELWFRRSPLAKPAFYSICIKETFSASEIT